MKGIYSDTKILKSKKNSYQFNLDQDRKIKISSDFDNGNISLIKQVTQLQYRLQCVPDVINSNNKKCWFFFKVTAPQNIKLRFNIQGVNMYQQMYQEYKWGKPVYRIGQQGKWKTLQDSFLIVNFNFMDKFQYRQQIHLVIDFTFQKEETIYFAMTIPFTYKDNEQYLNNLKHIIPQSLIYKDEVIAVTSNNKNVHMLTIQDKQLQQEKQESKSGRTIILITARVHPGQVSSSYCLMGMLNFILKPFSLQSEILRKMFTFVIFPMVNPDGVYEGNYRMDLNGQNLNRVYLQPNSSKHQTIFAIKNKFNEFLLKGDRIMFHFDLHSHSSLRKSFLYGNAFDDIVVQSQTELYCKLLDRNSIYIQQSLCQFGQKHMKFKDKGQLMTKQGCARVVISKLASVIYSYTIQSSIFPIQKKTEKKNLPINLQFQIQGQQNQYNLGYDSFQEKDRYYSQEQNIIDQNKILGINIMQTILDLLIKNPYSSYQQKDLDQFRSQIAWKNLQNQQRFKMLDTKAYYKYKNITQFAKQQIHSKFKDQWSWLASHKIFSKILWPQKYVWFKKSNQTAKQKNKVKSQIKSLKSNIKSAQSLKKQKQQNQFNFIRTNQIQKSQGNERQLPLIRKSLQMKNKKSNNQEEILSKQISNSQNVKQLLKNKGNTRSNVLLTFVQDLQERKEHKRNIQKKILSLKLGSLNKYSRQNRLQTQKNSQNINQRSQITLPLVKTNNSQQNLPIKSMNSFQKINLGKTYLKSLDPKNSRRQLLNNKITMLKKVNQTKKNANKASLVKFPEIGKAFLVTNLKNRFQSDTRLKTTIQQICHEQNQLLLKNKYIKNRILTCQDVQ